ncbi:MAG TPA: elongation factor G [Candidatus Stercoripulliclostridium merdigallinarum]|uniref:Elongation factor G n=1 Tax=Candidatus Stercoripulliclostridium merdigallinarum TaxID=2840951 RepID=A0A9D1MIL3_9FIRM|nr:elongation factor G [Candidatus Stercoripulliclostridium merdigallinarum]
MAVFHKDKIRNIALIGHGGEGKTSLLEAMLYKTKAIDRLGKVNDGNTVSDYDQEEIARKMSISLSMAYVLYKDYKFNVLDVPGFFDFEGEMVAALSVADAAILVTGATGAVPVGAEKALEYCSEHNVPVFIWVNGVNKENSSFDATLQAYRDKYGAKVIAIELPIMQGTNMKGYVDAMQHKAFDTDGAEIAIPAKLEGKLAEEDGILMEAVAEASEELMEKYFGGEDISAEEKRNGLRTRFAAGEVYPVVAGVAVDKPVLTALFDHIVDLFPAPGESVKHGYTVGDKHETVDIDENGKFAAQVFKTIVDPFIGKLLMFKVMRGKVSTGDTVYNVEADENEKISSMSIIRGKKQEAVDQMFAGDIGAFAKLNYTTTNNTLCDPSEIVKFDPIEFPEPVISFAVSSADKGSEDKVFAGLNKMLDEDSTFTLEKNAETNEMIISGMGEMQLDIICKKVKNKFNATAVLKEPRIAYRETIKKTVEAEGKHKKQSGGAGQFGQCSVRFEPGAADGVFEFVDAVVGGAIPRQYIPAVEKGLREAAPKGILADYPVINLKCTVFDGKSHPVDSKEIAFITAAKLAFQDGCSRANPVFLEPIMHIDITVPDSYMGDIMGDLSKRRGRILGTDSVNGKTVVSAEAPQAELAKYATDLRSMTQGRGKFVTKFERYEEVPASQAAKIIEDYKKRQAAAQ